MGRHAYRTNDFPPSDYSDRCDNVPGLLPRNEVYCSGGEEESFIYVLIATDLVVSYVGK